MRKVIVAAIGALVIASQVYARPSPQWVNVPQNISQWFRSLMQPDNPLMSCCGESDSFEADNFETEGDHYVAVITDGRGMIKEGARIPVPNSKIKWDSGNPTGHGIIFLSGVVPVTDSRYVYVLADERGARILYCFVPPSGV